MFAIVSRWLRPVPPAPAAPSAAPPGASAAGRDAAVQAPDSAGLRARFLATALARPEPFAGAQTAGFLSRLQAASDGEGFDALRLPRLPAVLPPLLQALREDNAGLGEVADLAARDPVLAGGIIRVANSAYYGNGEPLASLSQAVVRVGRDAVRRVVLQLALRPIHPAVPGTPVHAAGERLWTHAQCCGIACAAMGHGFEGMLAGLAGATGASAALGLLVRDGPELLHAEAVHAAFPRAMWRIAARAARAWELPTDVVAALYAHAEEAGGEAGGELARGLAGAERLSMHYLLQRWEDPALAAPLESAEAAAAWAALKHHHPDG